jgi:hypothetical protein
MNKLLFYWLFFLPIFINAQGKSIDLSFKNCAVNFSSHPDSLYKDSLLFVGNGEIHILADSIIVTFVNEWECGKYHMNILEKYSWVENNMNITKYSGQLTYFGGEYSALLFCDLNGKVLSFVWDNQWVQTGGVKYAQKRRIYYDLQNLNRQLLHSFSN